MSERAESWVILLGLALSALALALAPLLMPVSYSWITHTTSESAAQGLSGAWLARVGLGTFGIAVLILAWKHTSWRPAARFAHFAFGAMMTVTALASTRPWVAGLPFDAAEDQIHSFAATVLGFAFAFGILAAVLGDRKSGRPVRSVHLIAILASIVIPLAMTVMPQYAGILQRLMFVVAYAWYALATLESTLSRQATSSNWFQRRRDAYLSPESTST